MKVYHLVAKEIGGGIEINVSAEEGERFSSFEILGSLELVKANILGGLRGGMQEPPSPTSLILPSMN